MVWLVALAGCGRLGFTSTGNDGGDDDSASTADGSPDAFMPPTGPFVSPSVSQDGLRLYFISLASSDDIFVSSRATTTAPWGAAMPIAELNTTVEESGPSINTTETFVVFASTRAPTAGGSDLWTARRATTGTPWGPSQPLAELNTSGAETDPWLSPDERTIVFARNNNLFIATR